MCKEQHPKGGETDMAASDVDDLDLEEDFDDLDAEEEAAAPKPKAAKKASGIGAKAVADKLGANDKTFRAWLRRKVEASAQSEEDDAFSHLVDREARSRYSWPKWSDPDLKGIMKAWKEDDHTRGGRRKSEEDDAEGDE